IDGVVVDETGKPVPGARVTVESDFTRTTRTTRSSDDGTFRVDFDVPSLRSLRLLASVDEGKHLGGQDLAHKLRLTERATRCRLVVRPSRTLTVRVVDEKDQALPGATVGVYGSGSICTSALTDAQGTAVLRLPVEEQVHQVVALK